MASTSPTDLDVWDTQNEECEQEQLPHIPRVENGDAILPALPETEPSMHTSPAGATHPAHRLPPAPKGSNTAKAKEQASMQQSKPLKPGISSAQLSAALSESPTKKPKIDSPESGATKRTHRRDIAVQKAPSRVTTASSASSAKDSRQSNTKTSNTKTANKESSHTTAAPSRRVSSTSSSVSTCDSSSTLSSPTLPGDTSTASSSSTKQTTKQTTKSSAVPPQATASSTVMPSSSIDPVPTPQPKKKKPTATSRPKANSFTMATTASEGNASSSSSSSGSRSSSPSVKLTTKPVAGSASKSSPASSKPTTKRKKTAVRGKGGESKQPTDKKGTPTKTRRRRSKAGAPSSEDNSISPQRSSSTHVPSSVGVMPASATTHAPVAACAASPGSSGSPRASGTNGDGTRVTATTSTSNGTARASDDDGQDLPLQFVALRCVKEQLPPILQPHFLENIDMRNPSSTIEEMQMMYCFVTFMAISSMTVFEQSTTKQQDLKDALKAFQVRKDTLRLDRSALEALLRFHAEMIDLRIVADASELDEATIINVGSDSAIFVMNPCGVLFRASDIAMDEEATDLNDDTAVGALSPPHIGDDPDLDTAVGAMHASTPEQHGFAGEFTEPIRDLQSIPTSPIDQQQTGTGAPNIYPQQQAVGASVFERIRTVLLSLELDIERDSVDKAARLPFDELGGILMLVPNFNSLYAQTRSRAQQFLQQQGVPEDKVLVVKCNAACADEVKTFWRGVETNRDKLFVVLHDEAHWAIDRSPNDDSSSGVADLFLNQPRNKGVKNARNLVRLLVTATPYALQTGKSAIPLVNEIHWDAVTGGSEESSENHGPRYFGMSDLQGQHKDPKRQRLVMDSSFHALVSECVGRRKPGTREQLMAKFFQCYEAAFLLALHDIMGTKLLDREELESHTTPLTLRMITRFLKATTSTNGHGHMLLIRVVSNPMGRALTLRLRELRAKLGLDKRFAVLQDTSADPLRRVLELDERSSECLSRLQQMTGASGIASYEQLEHLPCILVLCDKGRMGDTFPKSLQYYDLRLRYGSSSSCTRTYMEQDLGRMFRYARSLDELPMCLLPPTAHECLQRSLIHLSPDRKANISKPPKGEQIPRPKPSENWSSRNDSLFYRTYARPTSKNYDEGNRRGTDPRRFLLQGKPQVGKTGAYLWALKLLAEHLNMPPGPTETEEVVVCCDDDDFDDEGNERELDMDEDEQQQQNHRGVLPVHTVVQSLPFVAPQPGKYGAIIMDQRVHAARLAAAEAAAHGDNGDVVVDGAPGNRSRLVVRKTVSSEYALMARPQPPSAQAAAGGNAVVAEFAAPVVAELSVNSDDEMNRERTLGSRWHIPAAKAVLFQGLISRGDDGTAATFERIRVEDLDMPVVFMPSSGRAAIGLLDLSRTLRSRQSNSSGNSSTSSSDNNGSGDGGVHKVLQVIVVKQDEFDAYCTHYPDVVVCALPEAASSPDKGIGASRDFIKRFATLNLDLTRHAARAGGVRLGRVASLILMLDDSCLVFKRAVVRQDPCDFHTADDVDVVDGAQHGGASDDHQREWKWDWANRENRSEFTMEDVPLLHVLQHMLSDPDLHRYALMGISRWRPFLRNMQSAYKRAHPFSFLLLNVDVTRDVHYEANDLLCEDIRFNERLNARDLLFVKYCRFVLLKKQLAEGGCSALLERAHVDAQNETHSRTFEVAALPDTGNDFSAKLAVTLDNIPTAELIAAAEGDASALLDRLADHLVTILGPGLVSLLQMELVEPRMLCMPAGTSSRPHQVQCRICLKEPGQQLDMVGYTRLRSTLAYIATVAQTQASVPLSIVLDFVRKHLIPVPASTRVFTIGERPERDANVPIATAPTAVIASYTTNPIEVRALTSNSEWQCLLVDMYHATGEHEGLRFLLSVAPANSEAYYYLHLGWVLAIKR
ncbi:hypothetical protein PTSG_06081 [Salpingoeca rosetta]|uniref:Uncharacterized protein n=1 Tax=Salpingoeca rosetta (strain ATCC 50818 / BSB-021) TaxID=946362 RepID=F2UDM5_SALR5|nr:uncharacterized protein PTSG_06081 [Salpingoeca rosetta]EGD74720.1 hypothetical protein PTSG_06081 [Salpingoeca rosetta]|eukprot:XP_004992977.1 hypothetical protein PTSG_06081 [Salpingoeca rosetta]